MFQTPAPAPDADPKFTGATRAVTSFQDTILLLKPGYPSAIPLCQKKGAFRASALLVRDIPYRPPQGFCVDKLMALLYR